jgi:lipopolysaccharide cholinephosphotransferase
MSRKIDSVDALQDQLWDMLVCVARVFEDAGVDYHLSCGTALGAVRHLDFIPWDFDVDITVPIDQYEVACRALSRGLPPRYRLRRPRGDHEYEQLFARVHLASVHHKYAHVDIYPLVGTSSNPRLQAMHLRASKELRRLFFYKRRASRLVTSTAKSRRLVGRVLTVALAVVPASFLIWCHERLEVAVPIKLDGDCMNILGGAGVRERMPTRQFLGHESGVIRTRDFPLPRQVDEYLTRLYGNYSALPPEEYVDEALEFFKSWYLPALREIDLQVSDTI